LDGFIEGALKLAYGPNSKPLLAKRIVGLYSLSGTGALSLGTGMFKRWLPEGTAVYIPKPTWPNHKNICETSGLKWKEYRYYDAKTKGVDFNGVVADIDQAPTGSVILLHVCAHNPTGADFNLKQWQEVRDLIVKKKTYPILRYGIPRFH